eukprot:CAMPEP_0203666590 /NCGR_PEP_ID=MMETSP0090-20130426/3602_1 /ASSEMBLY_ACC=CAM_ASM_001088 /TAXON_ID=426623 /ORGANISM="Chaetoceros affinis, Strain CCMP159" /LENGTH=31 /DNA_ID= /DNA_START= /DNA_END= /DNA_ORIENTATION=
MAQVWKAPSATKSYTSIYEDGAADVDVSDGG